MFQKRHKRYTFKHPQPSHTKQLINYDYVIYVLYYDKCSLLVIF